MDNREVWLIDAVRTPVGRLGGALSGVRPDDLGALVLAELVERTGVDKSEIEDVYMGCVNQAGEDNRNVARMCALMAGLPETVGGCTVNRLCASGADAVANAYRAIVAGEGELFIGAGVESMSRAPLVTPKTDKSFKIGDPEVYDTTIGWRMVNPKMETLGYTDTLGVTAENLAEEYSISRQAQDEFALASHRKALRAQEEGVFNGELVGVETPGGLFESDEGPRRNTSLEKLGSLKPVFKGDGTVTAGNSCQMSDGAAAMMLASSDFARAHGLKPLARVAGAAVAGVAPRTMGIGPVPATEKLLGRAGLTMDDLDYIELNEAFAAQVLSVVKSWEIAPEDPRLNPHGGAIALGHPLGCTGAKLITTLAHTLSEDSRAQWGLATLCVGVGQGLAVLLERV